MPQKSLLDLALFYTFLLPLPPPLEDPVSSRLSYIIPKMPGSRIIHQKAQKKNNGMHEARSSRKTTKSRKLFREF